MPAIHHMQEDKFAKKALQLLGTAARDGTLANMTSSLTPAPDRNKGKFLFDLVSCRAQLSGGALSNQQDAKLRHLLLQCVCVVLPEQLSPMQDDTPS